MLPPNFESLTFLTAVVFLCEFASIEYRRRAGSQALVWLACLTNRREDNRKLKWSFELEGNHQQPPVQPPAKPDQAPPSGCLSIIILN
jgi:hypothetical protein